MNLTSSCLLAIISALSLGAAGCTTACSDVGCSNQVEVTVANLVPHVTHNFGTLKVCASNTCQTFDVKYAHGQSTCAVRVDEGFDSCSVLADGSVRVSISLPSEPPENVSVSFTPENDAPIERTAAIGDRSEEQPNGPDCDPTCHTGKSTVSL